MDIHIRAHTTTLISVGLGTTFVLTLLIASVSFAADNQLTEAEKEATRRAFETCALKLPGAAAKPSAA